VLGALEDVDVARVAHHRPLIGHLERVPEIFDGLAQRRVELESARVDRSLAGPGLCTTVAPTSSPAGVSVGQTTTSLSFAGSGVSEPAGCGCGCGCGSGEVASPAQARPLGHAITAHATSAEQATRGWRRI